MIRKAAGTMGAGTMGSRSVTEVEGVVKIVGMIGEATVSTDGPAAEKIEGIRLRCCTVTTVVTKIITAISLSCPEYWF